MCAKEECPWQKSGKGGGQGTGRAWACGRRRIGGHFGCVENNAWQLLLGSACPHPPPGSSWAVNSEPSSARWPAPRLFLHVPSQPPRLPYPDIPLSPALLLLLLARPLSGLVPGEALWVLFVPATRPLNLNSGVPIAPPSSSAVSAALVLAGTPSAFTHGAHGTQIQLNNHSHIQTRATV